MKTKRVSVYKTRASPYVQDIPELRRPFSGSMTRHKTYDEKLYCWFFWLEAIQDPSLTGQILEDLENIPTFNSEWGKHFRYGKKISDAIGWYGFSGRDAVE